MQQNAIEAAIFWRLSRASIICASVAVFMLVLSLAAVRPALADEPPEGGAENSPTLPPSAIAAARSANGDAEVTDPAVAAALPHSDLDRGEALELLEGVFDPSLEGAAGIFDSLDVNKFISSNAAVVAPVERSEAVTVGGGEGEEGASSSPVLLESTVPLFVPGQDGLRETVDLTLEHSDGQLLSAAALEPVAIPEELGEGLELPESGIAIQLVGAPSERAPSILDESVAAYPNVAPDTDFAIAPTPTGLETLATLRSPDAARSEQLKLTLPSGAVLAETEDGGAVATLGGEPILDVKPASAIDANGDPVPVEMKVSGDELTLTVSPAQDTAWPVLVDPLMEGFAWQAGATPTTAGWSSWSNSPKILLGYGENWGPGHNGLYIEAQHEYFNVGAQAVWTHGVPRLEEEEAKGKYPTSFITNFSLQGISMITTAGLASPFLFGGIFDPSTSKWSGDPGNEAVWSWPGNAPSWLQNATLNFENGTPSKRDQHAQRAYGMSLAVSEPGWLGSPRASYLGAASVQIADEDSPTVANPKVSSLWVNQYGASPITVEAADTGLGVKNVTFAVPGQGEITVSNACGGQTADPCPSRQTVSLGSYSPAKMPQGYDYVAIRAHDVLWNPTPENALARALVKVDHTAPQVALSGTLTEQAKLGTNLAQYTVKYSASDGTEAAPQSGVASTEVKLDGKAVEARYAPGCAEESCSISREWTLNSSQYPVGPHTIEVVATDAVGLSTTKTLSINLTADTTAPTIAASGAFFEGPEGWLRQQTYSASVHTTDAKGSGVAALSFKLDGSTIGSTSASCKLGGCELSLAKSVNTALYAGGAHQAEVVATDARGNTSKRTWIINVDPSGHVSNQEAEDTLEAAEDTTEPTEPTTPPLAENSSFIGPEEIAAGNNPGLSTNGGTFVSTGTAVDSEISEDPSQGATLHIEDEQTAASGGMDVEVTPLNVAGEATNAQVSAGMAAVAANDHPSTDTVVRPKYDGVLQFETIRSPTAPETYEWEVSLAAGQALKSIDEQNAGVFYKDGTEMMLISAEPANDATGKAIPTSLSVTGTNIITLTVHHRATETVYPVLAGSAFEVGYTTVEVIIPPPPVEGGQSAPEGDVLEVSAPEPATPEEAGITDRETLLRAAHNTVSHGFIFRRCETVFEYVDPTGPGVPRRQFHCGNPFTGEPSSGEVAFEFAVRGRFFVSPGLFVAHAGTPTTDIGCDKHLYPEHFSDPDDEWTIQPAYFINPDQRCVWWGITKNGGGSRVGVGKHLTGYGEWNAGRGHTNEWNTYQLGSAAYIWATDSPEGYFVDKNKTTCIDC